MESDGFVLRSRGCLVIGGDSVVFTKDAAMRAADFGSFATGAGGSEFENVAVLGGWATALGLSIGLNMVSTGGEVGKMHTLLSLKGGLSSSAGVVEPVTMAALLFSVFVISSSLRSSALLSTPAYAACSVWY